MFNSDDEFSFLSRRNKFQKLNENKTLHKNQEALRLFETGLRLDFYLYFLLPSSCSGSFGNDPEVNLQAN